MSTPRHRKGGLNASPEADYAIPLELLQSSKHVKEGDVQDKVAQIVFVFRVQRVSDLESRQPPKTRCAHIAPALARRAAAAAEGFKAVKSSPT